MANSIKALFVDDSQDDVLLLARMLTKGGCDLSWERVETQAEMRAALLSADWNIVICDFKMPDFDGLAAIALLKELSPSTPIILVSGTIGEETAVECMKAGACDYLMKNNLIRLVPAVERELREAQIRKERTIMERELRESERQYRQLVDQSNDAILLTKPDGAILDANPAACRIFGRSVDDIRSIGRNALVDLTDPRLHEALEKRSRAGSGVAEFTMVRATGEKFPAEVSSSVFTDGDGETKTSMIIRDITQRRLMEERLLQSQKMEAIGQLASGVAHDFNNMLGVILGYVEMAIDMVEPSGELHASLLEIRKAAERSSTLTKQLLSFARTQSASPETIDPNDAINGSLAMLRRLIGEDISLDFRPGATIWPVRIDQSQIDQILVNLCVNSRDAIAKDGIIAIETQNIALSESPHSDHVGVPPGEYVMVAFSDNGCGIAQEIIDKVFDPFFTTKPKGKGTGLGLSTVYEIVRQIGGFIKASSEANQGTVFRAYLPRSADRSEEAPEKAPDGNPVCCQETLLVVEDEQALLFLSKAILEAKGYKVLTAGLPSEAIRLAGEYTGDVDLLMTDVVLPEMNGKELAEKICALRGNIKRLFVSGYSAETMVREGVLDPGSNFLSKPYSVNDLLSKVREILDRETKCA